MAIFRSEARRLKKEGVEILIALGHAGYREVDLQMAGEVIVDCPTQLIYICQYTQKKVRWKTQI